MPLEQSGWPLRSTVEAAWRAVATGERAREDAHLWTVPWVEGDAGNAELSDAPVLTGLQHIHGLAMAYDPETPHLIHDGPPGVYVRTLHEIGVDFEKWLDDCRRYDEDPALFSRLARERARAAERRDEVRGTKDGPA